LIRLYDGFAIFRFLIKKSLYTSFLKELKKDGDGVYKIKLRNEKYENPEQFNYVQVYLTSGVKRSLVVDGILENI
jgi:hypothetical protein